MTPMTSRWIILFLLLIPGLVSAAIAPLGSNDIAQARSYGTNSLLTFRALVTPANFQLLGFHSTNEVLQVTNAEPIPVYTVILAQLQNYHPGDPISGLLELPSRVIVPLMLGTDVRSSITLRLVPGGAAAPGTQGVWTTENWGQPKLIRDLIATYRMIPSADVRPGTKPFAVEIPVFDIWLIGYYDTQNELVLRSTVDLRLGQLTVFRHEFVTEAAVVRLSNAALRYNGLPN